MSPRKQLYSLFKALDPDSVRRILLYDAEREDLVTAVNWKASAEAVADDVVSRLEREGPDPHIYAALLAALPGRAEDVRRLAAEVGVRLEVPKAPKPVHASFDGTWTVGGNVAALVWTGQVYVYAEFQPDGFPAALGRATPAAGGVDVVVEHVLIGPFTTHLIGDAQVLRGVVNGQPVELHRSTPNTAVDAWRARHAALLVGDAGGLLTRRAEELGLFGPSPVVDPTGRWLCQSPMGPFAIVFGGGQWQQINPVGGAFGGGLYRCVGPYVKFSGQSEGMPTQGWLLVAGMAAQGQILARGMMVLVTAQRG